MSLFIEPDIVDAGRRRAAIARLREMKVTLPTWSELAYPADIAGEDLVAAISRAPATEYLLIEADGQMYGVLAAEDVSKTFAGV